MDAETAEWVAAEQVLLELDPVPCEDIVITRVERVSSTWVVYWDSRSTPLTNNGPALVADDYRVGQAGTSLPVEQYVRDFEATSS